MPEDQCCLGRSLEAVGLEGSKDVLAVIRLPPRPKKEPAVSEILGDMLVASPYRRREYVTCFD